jgi:hypothetical protein
MDPEREPLKPTIEQVPERRSAEQTPPTPEEDVREEEGWDQPESSAQKAPPPGPHP